jgi:PAS domain S-box-containing protein
MFRSIRKPLLEYGAAVAAVAIAILLRWLADRWLGDFLTLMTVYVAISAAVLVGGYRPAVAAALIGYFAAAYLFIEPRGEFGSITQRNAIGFVTYVGSCGLIIFSGEALRAARRRAADEKRGRETQLEIITNSMSAPVTRCSRDFRYLWVSEPYAEWIGRPSEEIIGRPIVDIIGPEAFGQLRPHFDLVLSGQPVRYEERINFRGLGPRWISAAYTPTVDANGAVDGWVAVVIDIEERRRMLEALREADRHKDEFLATLAHELRNPLAPIQNALQIMEAVSDDADQIERARRVIERQFGQLVRLVDDLLDASRIGRGKLSLRRERVDLEFVINSALEMSRPQIDAADHDLVVTLPDRRVALDVDATRLTQVFSNLLNNAAKFTPRGGRIAVNATIAGGEIRVSVMDNGIGIPPDRIAEVFEIFAQAGPAVENTQGGLGIGLSLVKGLIEMHGGRVEARSAGPGAGSEFVVHLPLATGDAFSPETERSGASVARG